jgi:hypothetical protein
VNFAASGAYQDATEANMYDGLSIEGYAIVSRNGMLAGDDGLMPNSLKFDEDQKFLDEEMDKAALLIHGRKSHEAQDNSHKRKRLLLTRSGGPFSTNPAEPNTWLWTPEATPFAEVCKALGITSGVVAVLGGTAAYDLFLPAYTRFHLALASRVDLPEGVPVFGAVREGHPPATVLQAAGLKLADQAVLNAEDDLWRLTFVRERSAD